MQVQDGGRAELEWAACLEPVVDHFDHHIKLLQAVSGFLLCTLVGVADEFSVKRPAVPVVRGAHFLAFSSRSASSSTISRVIREFSILVLP
jgi:hypothetical protein